MWLIVLEEGRVDVFSFFFSCSGGVGEVRPHWVEGERTLRRAGPGGGVVEGLIQQLSPRTS